jgi:hypothetical protein
VSSLQFVRELPTLIARNSSLKLTLHGHDQYMSVDKLNPGPRVITLCLELSRIT